jgi:hypothetical protein
MLALAALSPSAGKVAEVVLGNEIGRMTHRQVDWAAVAVLEDVRINLWRARTDPSRRRGEPEDQA